MISQRCSNHDPFVSLSYRVQPYSHRAPMPICSWQSLIQSVFYCYLEDLPEFDLSCIQDSMIAQPDLTSRLTTHNYWSCFSLSLSSENVDFLWTCYAQDPQSMYALLNLDSQFKDADAVGTGLHSMISLSNESPSWIEFPLRLLYWIIPMKSLGNCNLMGSLALGPHRFRS